MRYDGRHFDDVNFRHEKGPFAERDRKDHVRSPADRQIMSPVVISRRNLA